MLNLYSVKFYKQVRARWQVRLANKDSKPMKNNNCTYLYRPSLVLSTKVSKRFTNTTLVIGNLWNPQTCTFRTVRSRHICVPLSVPRGRPYRSSYNTTAQLPEYGTNYSVQVTSQVPKLAPGWRGAVNEVPCPRTQRKNCAVLHERIQTHNFSICSPMLYRLWAIRPPQEEPIEYTLVVYERIGMYVRAVFGFTRL